MSDLDPVTVAADTTITVLGLQQKGARKSPPSRSALNAEAYPTISSGVKK
jgi:hypothetical protein